MKSSNIIAAVVVVLLVAVGVYFVIPKGPDAPAPAGDVGAGFSGGEHNALENFSAGVGIGGEAHYSKRLIIPAGENQVAWRNTTGRDFYLDTPNVGIGYTSGTASSSLLAYVSIETTATVDDFAAPDGTLVLQGSAIATSTAADVWRHATTSTDGTGYIVPAGSYLVFNVQSLNTVLYSIACTGATCETATSTNRGVSQFVGFLSGHFAP